VTFSVVIFGFLQNLATTGHHFASMMMDNRRSFVAGPEDPQQTDKGKNGAQYIKKIKNN
jgi:hypothetical protein